MGEGGRIYYKLYICDNINSFRVMIDELVGGKTKNLIPLKIIIIRWRRNSHEAFWNKADASSSVLTHRSKHLLCLCCNSHFGWQWQMIILVEAYGNKCLNLQADIDIVIIPDTSNPKSSSFGSVSPTTCSNRFESFREWYKHVIINCYKITFFFFILLFSDFRVSALVQSKAVDKIRWKVFIFSDMSFMLWILYFLG